MPEKMTLEQVRSAILARPYVEDSVFIIWADAIESAQAELAELRELYEAEQIALYAQKDEVKELRARLARLEAPVSGDEVSNAWDIYLTCKEVGDIAMRAALTAFLSNRMGE